MFVDLNTNVHVFVLRFWMTSTSSGEKEVAWMVAGGVFDRINIKGYTTFTEDVFGNDFQRGWLSTTQIRKKIGSRTFQKPIFHDAVLTESEYDLFQENLKLRSAGSANKMLSAANVTDDFCLVSPASSGMAAETVPNFPLVCEQIIGSKHGYFKARPAKA